MRNGTENGRIAALDGTAGSTSATIALINGLTSAARVRAASSSSARLTSPDRINSASPPAASDVRVNSQLH